MNVSRSTPYDPLETSEGKSKQMWGSFPFAEVGIGPSFGCGPSLRADDPHWHDRAHSCGSDYESRSNSLSFEPLSTWTAP
jgi:hypothetical protein